MYTYYFSFFIWFSEGYHVTLPCLQRYDNKYKVLSILCYRNITYDNVIVGYVHPHAPRDIVVDYSTSFHYPWYIPLKNS